MPHILLIEDNLGDAVLVHEMYHDADVLGHTYTITHVQRIRDAITLLSGEHTIDLILSDMTLPDSQGLETLRSLSSIASQLPVIFMTGTNDMVFVSAALKAGAQDYLVKGTIDAQLLSRATRYSIERKKAQIGFDKANQKADELAESRDLLQNQKLELLALNRAKDEFISLSSHQLRTPATSVKQYLGMIIDGFVGEVPEHLEVFIRTAYESNERQLTIINDLLKTARLDSGRYELEKTMTNLCDLAQEVLEDYRPIIAMRDQSVSYVTIDDCMVQVDAAEMRIAIANLIEDASKYSPTGSRINITVSRYRQTIRFGVEDKGVGIDRIDLRRIFEKFTRVDNALSDTVSGSGLGLYFVERIVRIHGGKVVVTSEVGQGSRFVISLPAFNMPLT